MARLSGRRFVSSRIYYIIQEVIRYGKYFIIMYFGGYFIYLLGEWLNNNGKDDVKYAALTQKDLDALPVEKRARFWMNWGFIHEYGIRWYR